MREQRDQPLEVLEVIQQSNKHPRLLLLMPSAAVAAVVEVVQLHPVQMVEVAAVQAALLDKLQEAERLDKGFREVVRALMQTRTEVLAVAERVQSAQMETLAQQLVVMD